jgi:hypothetical protein
MEAADEISGYAFAWCSIPPGAKDSRRPPVAARRLFAFLRSRGASPAVGKQLRVLDPERQAEHANRGSLRSDATNLDAVDRARADARE